MPEDAQAPADTRGIVLPEVGIENLVYPLSIADEQGGKQQVGATVTISVSLDTDTKGVHLSWFIEVRGGWRDPLCPGTAISMVDELRQRMGSTTARAKLAFLYFLERESPITGTALPMSYECALIVT